MKKPHTLSGVIKTIIHHSKKSSTKLGDIIDVFGQRVYGPLLFILALMTLTPLAALPGAPILLGFAILLISAQYLYQQGSPWLPKWVKNKKIKSSKVKKYFSNALPAARWVDKVTKPRLLWFCHEQAYFASMIFIMLMAISFVPMSLIPLGLILPGLVIMVFSISIITRDGLMNLLGFIASISIIVFILVKLA